MPVGRARERFLAVSPSPLPSSLPWPPALGWPRSLQALGSGWCLQGWGPLVSPPLTRLSRCRPASWEPQGGRPAGAPSRPVPLPSCCARTAAGAGRGRAPRSKDPTSRPRRPAREAVVPSMEDTAVISQYHPPGGGQLCPYLCPGAPDSKAMDKRGVLAEPHHRPRGGSRRLSRPGAPLTQPRPSTGVRAPAGARPAPPSPAGHQGEPVARSSCPFPSQMRCFVSCVL